MVFNKFVKLISDSIGYSYKLFQNILVWNAFECALFFQFEIRDYSLDRYLVVWILWSCLVWTSWKVKGLSGLLWMPENLVWQEYHLIELWDHDICGPQIVVHH